MFLVGTCRGKKWKCKSGVYYEILQKMKCTMKNRSLTEHLVLEFKTKLTVMIAFLISMNFNILETGGGWGWGCIEVCKKSPEGLTRISTHKVVKSIRTACLNILNRFLPPRSYRLHVWDCLSARYAPGRKVARAQCRTSSAVSCHVKMTTDKFTFSVLLVPLQSIILLSLFKQVWK